VALLLSTSTECALTVPPVPLPMISSPPPPLDPNVMAARTPEMTVTANGPVVNDVSPEKS
jgi:hypothetical protein